MLHRLFNAQNRRLSEADLRSHLLLHGEHSDRIGTLEGNDVRLVIAQDLGEKTKVVLLDTQRPFEHKCSRLDYTTDMKSCTNQAPKRPPGLPTPKETTSSPELITELMFGTAPLSYRGTSVRLHPLPLHDTNSRSFLFTKVFTIDFAGGMTTETPDSSFASLSSSYGSATGVRAEYPFPTMTPIQDERTSGRAPCRDNKSRDYGTSPSRGFRGQVVHHPRPRSASSANRNYHHQRVPSGGNRSELGDVAPYVPFTKSETNQAHDDQMSAWLPSPGPLLTRRRLSTDTNGSASPGSQAGANSRYQAAMCGIGIIFTIPGNGHEETECALMTRCWQMMTRATYALQRVIYDELETTCQFITAYGVIQTPRSRNKVPKGEAQVFQRGKKFYVALGQYFLHSSQPVMSAVEKFRARLTGGVNLPEIQHTPLIEEADILVEELSFMMTSLDHKEAKFMFSTLVSYMVEYVATMKTENVERKHLQHSSLQNRLVIVSDNVVLARRLIYCIARLFFRDHNEHLQAAVDYALVWPSSGLLRMPKRDLLRQKQSTMAKAIKTNRGWDIPGHARQLSSGSYNMPLMSPSLYPRTDTSTTSNPSSRSSSWKPSWSWFANGSRTALSADESNRSDTRTVHTSWTSADFVDMPKSPSLKARSPRSWSPDVHTQGKPDKPQSQEDSATDDDNDTGESGSVETTVPPLHIEARKCSDGIVEVAFLSTVSISAESDVSEVAQFDEAHSDFPLTGVLSRFHPDMLLQAIPQAAYTDSTLKECLSEENLHIPDQPATHDGSWTRMASITVAELGNAWRLRRLTRLVREVAQSPKQPMHKDENSSSSFKSPEQGSSRRYEENWDDEVLTDINEPLVQGIATAIREYKSSGDAKHVQEMIDALPTFKTQ